MLGPARDDTGFEQGGINSGDFYKLYNIEQLKNEQRSALGVDIDSSVAPAEDLHALVHLNLGTFACFLPSSCLY